MEKRSIDTGLRIANKMNADMPFGGNAYKISKREMSDAEFMEKLMEFKARVLAR